MDGRTAGAAIYMLWASEPLSCMTSPDVMMQNCGRFGNVRALLMQMLRLTPATVRACSCSCPSTYLVLECVRVIADNLCSVPFVVIRP